MHKSASCLIVLVGAAVSAADPPGLPLTGVPLPPINTKVPPTAGDTLPTPRPMPPAPPQPPSPQPPREELAPAPREIHNLQPSPQFPGMPREEPAPMPHPATPPPPRLLSPRAFGAAPMADIQALHQAIEGLRLEREAMLNEQADLAAARDARDASGGESARLRRRITELLAKAAARVVQRSTESEKREKNPPRNPQHPHSPPTPAPAHPAPLAHPAPGSQKGGEKEGAAKQLTDAPVDPLTLAQALFQSGDAAAALVVYRKLEQEEQKPADRIAIQYMIACCLRKLGKSDEAAVMYREVANSGGGEVLVESAQWYLRALRERRELEAQLDQMRQRRQAVTPRKP